MKTKLFATTLAAVAIIPAASFGDVILYTVDPGRSSLSVAGSYNGFPLDPQEYPGGALTSYQGELTVDRNSSTDSLKIVGASAIASPNGNVSLGQIVHLPGFLPGTFGNYQLYARNGSPGAVTVGDFEGFITDFALGISSSTAVDPQSAGVSGIEVSILSGDLNFGTLNPSVGPLTDVPMQAMVDSSKVGSVADSNGIETLSIPLDFTMDFTANGKPLDLEFSGEIVATASLPAQAATVAPEPASILLLASFFSLLLGRRRHPQGGQHP